MGGMGTLSTGDSTQHSEFHNTLSLFSSLLGLEVKWPGRWFLTRMPPEALSILLKDTGSSPATKLLLSALEWSGWLTAICEKFLSC